MRALLAALVLTLLVSEAALAASEVPKLRTELPSATRHGIAHSLQTADSMCSTGAIVDDGSYENGYRIAFAPLDTRFVQLLRPSSYPTLLSQICACFETDQPAAAGISFVVYDATGPGGAPGSFLGAVNGSVSFSTGFTTAFTAASCASLGITLSSGSVYVGAQWDDAATPYDLFVCADETTSTPLAAMYESEDGGSSWSPVTNAHSAARALGLRATFGQAGACNPDSNTLCLNGGRFKVTATFNAGGGNSGAAHAVSLTSDTGYLWFFSPSNVEAVIKILNGCGLGGHYWVFAGGLTNVEVTITITDTQTNAVKTYVDPAKTVFQPIQDTGAFSTCP